MSGKKKVTWFSFIVLFLAILYFFYEFFLRVVLGPIAQEIMRDLHIGPEQFAIIGSAYYLSYGIMQTPVGILIDRFGVRILLTGACLVCTAGLFLFLSSHSFTPALIARLFIGFGSSFAFVSLLAIALNWFPREHFATLAGVIQLLGAVGPVMAGAPFAYALKYADNDWRLVFFWIGVFGIFLTLFLALFIRTAPKGEGAEIVFLKRSESLKQKLSELIGNSQVWTTIFYAGFVYGTMPLIGALWGASYLQAKGFDREKAAFLVSLVWYGLALGSPILSKFSDLIKRRKLPLIFAALVGASFGSLLIYGDIQSPILLGVCFFFLGFASAGQTLSFAAIAEHVPKKLHNTALGLNNTVIILFGSIIPPIASYLIKLESAKTGGVFTERAFEVGFTVVPLLYFVAFFLASFGTKETFCRQQLEIFPLDRE